MSISVSSPDLMTDPLNSPFPIPWRWILETHGAVVAGTHQGSAVYRSPFIYDPQKQFAAYCRVRLQLKPLLYESRVTSILFVEDLQTGMLNTVMARSPLAPHPFQTDDIIDAPGIISLLMPVSWSADGKKLLGRQFEGFLGSSDISDFGVIWDSSTKDSVTLAPSLELDYTHAILLGWSELNSANILFQAGSMGEEDWHIWAVAENGKTALADQDQGVVYGEMSSHIWSGSDAKFNN